MYEIGNQVAHPLHGAGVIEDIVEKRINGVLREYYIFRAPGCNIVIMIPLGACDDIGVRPVMGKRAAQDILENFNEIIPEVDSNWNRRYRDNMQRIKSGDLREVSSVVKGLMQRDRDRALSAGERKMLTAAKQILLSELGLATGRTISDLESTLDGML